jgi:hypothetical protein
MKLESTHHPADKLALALSRASGIVASVANCFNEHDENFAINAMFLAHALRTVDTFIIEASTALNHLNRDYDLSLPRAELEDSVRQETILAPLAEDIAPDDDYEADLVDADMVPGLDFAERARTYDELLRKVTAAEVFAATQDASAAQGKNDLVPLLNSLKEDLLRLRSVA